MNNFSYADILKDRQNFRRAGTKGGGDFNLFDNPTSKFFKIFFYFGNGDSTGNTGLENSGGLLSPTWLVDGLKTSNAYMYNSAYSYLRTNDELERAFLLKNFVELLSNISSESPWYFNSIEGLDAAIERKVATERDFKFEEQRQKITIKCLPDSYDDRIGTLLDLYRSVVWSWAHKREVLPANLRKFDMGILIFNDPTIPFHHYVDNGEKFADISKNSNYRPSYKYIEFHNCEIDYNSSKAGVTGLNNSTGIIPEYTIDIFFDDLYEYRYNEFSMKSMGDMLTIDHLIYSINNQLTKMTEEEKANSSSYKSLQKDLMSKLINYFETEDLGLGNDENESFEIFGKSSDLLKRVKNLSLSKSLKNAASQLIGTGVNIVGGLVKRAVLGNLYTFSLTRMADQALSLAEGNIWTAARNINEYAQDAKHRKEGGVQEMQGVQSIDNPGTLYEGQGKSIGVLDVDEIKSAEIQYTGTAIGNQSVDEIKSAEIQYSGTVIGNQSIDEIKSAEIQYNVPVQNNMNAGNPPRTRYVNRALGNLFTSSTIANNI